MLTQNAKVEVMVNNVIKNRRFNSFPKGREGQPEKDSSKNKLHLSDNDENDTTSRKARETLTSVLSGATPKVDTRIFAGRCEDTRCAEEEWTNQWRVWTGDNPRLHANNTRHTVRGDGTSQKRKADYNDPAQRNQHKTTRMKPDGHTKLGGGFNSMRDCSKVGMLSRRNIKKSDLMPVEDPFFEPESYWTPPPRKKSLLDATLERYNGKFAAPKFDRYFGRLKGICTSEKPEKANATLSLGKVVSLRSHPGPSEELSCTISREASVAKRNGKKTGLGADPRMSISHSTKSNKRWCKTYDEEYASTPETSHNISIRMAARPTKKVSVIDRPSNKQKRRVLMSASRIEDDEEQSTQHDLEINGGRKHVHFDDDAGVEASEGIRNIAKASDLTVDLWFREPAISRTLEASKQNRQEDSNTRKESSPKLVEPTNKNKTKPREHKARVLEVTMMVNGKESKIVMDNNEQSITETNRWDFKNKNIDSILEQLTQLKSDPTIPMPTIEADPSTIEEFLQYGKDSPTLLNYQEGSGLKDTEQTLDEPDLVYLREKCTDCYQNLMPKGFPEDLWPFVLDDDKPLIAERWKGYDLEKVGEKIDRLKNELRISNERPYAYPYFLAQAIANLDRYEVKESDGVTPTIHKRFTHCIELYPNSRPVREKPQRFSETQNAFLKAKLNILEQQGKVKQRNGLIDGDWLHRLVLVEYPTRMEKFRAKYGDNVQAALNDPANEYEVSQLFRLTVDCREVNKVTIIEPYPMPDNNMGKENIIGSRYMSISDAADAFYAVPVRESDHGKSGFTALGKQWVFTVMLQGGANSPGHFARIITETFEGIPHSKICPFQDDALCHGRTLRVALENQQLLYNRIRQNTIMLKANKTLLAFSTCKFLGNIYTPIGRLPDPAKVEAIMQINHRPCTPKDVRHIVGLIIWNIEFLPSGMALLSHLTDLIKKDADVMEMWEDKVHGKVLEQLKAGLVSAPCLKPIDVSKPFRVHVDACKNGRGIGAVLLQEYDDKWRPCAYFSKALKNAQRQWSATELEAHGLVTAVRHWDRYLQNGHKWTAVVDHKALIYLVVKRTKTNNTRLLNSVMSLQAHHFDIVHRNGDEHFDADSISRILHSGDIEEARLGEEESVDDERLVTMKDVRNLERLFKLRISNLSPFLLPTQSDKEKPTVQVVTPAVSPRSDDSVPANETQMAVEALLTLADPSKIEEPTGTHSC